MYKLFMLRKLLALCLGTLAYYVVGKLLEYTYSYSRLDQKLAFSAYFYFVSPAKSNLLYIYSAVE